MWVGLLYVVVAPVLSVFVSVKLMERAQEEARAAELRAAVNSRIAVCRLFSEILRGYDDEPPRTAAGERQRKAWLDVYQLSQCQPPRTK